MWLAVVRKAVLCCAGHEERLREKWSVVTCDNDYIMFSCDR